MIPPVLKPHIKYVTIASIIVVILGVVSAITFSLIGPTIKVLVNPGDTIVEITELIGPRLASFLKWLSLPAQATSGALVKNLSTAILLMALIRAILTQMHWYIWEWLSEKIALKIRQDIGIKLLSYPSLSDLAFEKNAIDDRLIGTLTTDLRLAKEYIVHFFGGLPREATQAFFYAITLWLLSPWLFAVFILGIIPAGLMLSNLGKKIKKRSSKTLDQYIFLSEWLQQRLSGSETIKHLGTEAHEAQTFRKLNNHLFENLYRTARVKARTAPILESLVIAAFVAVIALGIHWVRSEQVSGGVLVSFFSTLSVLAQSSHKLGRYFNSNREGQVAWQRIHDTLAILDAPQKSLQQSQSHELPNRFQQSSLVQLDEVTFQYNNSDPETPSGVNDISLNFAPGKIYCVCGPTGAGKSTLAKLLLGSITPMAGTIRFAQKDLLYVPQKLDIIPGSIAQSISYPDLNPVARQAQLSLEKVGLWRDIELMPLGLQTPMDPSHGSLSGGQLQRLYLARVHYHSAPLVLIDEGTSALDPVTELELMDQWRQLAQEGRCLIVISHRPAILSICDEIVLLSRGRIVAKGATAKVATSRLFQDLWQQQISVTTS